MPDQNTTQPQDGTGSPAPQLSDQTAPQQAAGAGKAAGLDFSYPDVTNGSAGTVSAKPSAPASPVPATDASESQPATDSQDQPPSPVTAGPPPEGSVTVGSPGSVAPVSTPVPDSQEEDAGVPPSDPALAEDKQEDLANLAQKLSTWKEESPAPTAPTEQGAPSSAPPSAAPPVTAAAPPAPMEQAAAEEPPAAEEPAESMGAESAPAPAAPVASTNPLSPSMGGGLPSSSPDDSGGSMFDPPAPLQTDKGGEEEPEEIEPATPPSTEVTPPDSEDSAKQETPAQQEVVSIQGSNTSGGYPYTIDDLMQIVVEKDASDLHITVDYPAMIRVDGVLLPVGQEMITPEVVRDLVLPTLPEAKQELLEVNREVDLAYTFRQDARFRINAFYTKGNISGAYRLIPNRIRTIEELKLPGAYHQLTQLPQGLVLVTGPTGHGKSTTLAAMLQEINETYPKHIITIEDPIEYVYPRARGLVDQREMHEDTHSWEIALRSAMREDPDVVLVGEMRDFETIQSVITLAETGHLVLATLHTNSAAQSIDRMVDVFPEHQQEQVQTQLSMILEAIISQRLLPVKSGGRRAVSEVLLATGAVKNLIREGKSHQIDNVIRTSLDVGMKTLEHSLVELIREGEITVEEAEGIAVYPEEISRLLKM